MAPRKAAKKGGPQGKRGPEISDDEAPAPALKEVSFICFFIRAPLEGPVYNRGPLKGAPSCHLVSGTSV